MFKEQKHIDYHAIPSQGSRLFSFDFQQFHVDLSFQQAAALHSRNTQYIANQYI